MESCSEEKNRGSVGQLRAEWYPRVRKRATASHFVQEYVHGFLPKSSGWCRFAPISVNNRYR